VKGEERKGVKREGREDDGRGRERRGRDRREGEGKGGEGEGRGERKGGEGKGLPPFWNPLFVTRYVGTGIIFQSVYKSSTNIPKTLPAPLA